MGNFEQRSSRHPGFGIRKDIDWVYTHYPKAGSGTPYARTIRAMLKNADLILTARLDGLLKLRKDVRSVRLS